MKTVEYKSEKNLIFEIISQPKTPLDIIEKVKDILKNVKDRKDEALKEYTLLFDKWNPQDGFSADREVLEKAWNSLRDEDKKAILHAKERIEDYHKYQLEKSWFLSSEEGILGMMVTPIEKVGAYVPGGRASLPSTVLMNVIPAKIAGVKEIYVSSPAPEGYKNPYILGCCYICGVEKVFLIGGAQAIGAFAFGTESVPKVDKIVGPGNIYVAEAKRQVFGIVGIDSVAGPSEILIIADDKADPVFVAADLLSQAEHDPMARAFLVTTSKKLAEQTKREIERQIQTLPTKEIAEKSLKENGTIIIVETLDDAIEVANRIAPEHLELLVEEPWELLPKIKNAGAIFLGNWSPEPIGDYIAGPNHTLPTGGTARFSSPLGVYDFLKRTSIIALNRAGFEKVAKDGMKLAEIEGLWAHKNSIKVRVERGKG